MEQPNTPRFVPVFPPGCTTVAYTRVSTQEQANTGVSLDSQQERVRLYCQLAGLNLAGLVTEEGISGTIALTDRPAGARLLALVKKHKARHVVALKLDRLFRSAVYRSVT